MSLNQCAVWRAGLGIILLSTIGWGCFGIGDQDTPEKWQARDVDLEAKKAELKKIETDLRLAVKNLGCEISSHCEVLALGAETCGKRSQFLVYSVKNSDTGTVENLVQRYNQISDELNRSSFKVLSCGKTPPRAVCMEKICLAEGYQLPSKSQPPKKSR